MSQAIKLTSKNKNQTKNAQSVGKKYVKKAKLAERAE